MTTRRTRINIGDGASLARLVPRERLMFDAEQRARLMLSQAGQSPMQITANLYEELSQNLRNVMIAHGFSAFDELKTRARRVRRLAMQAGLPELARAADHVVDCASQFDGTALSATMDRLQRLGDLALAELSP